MNTVSHKNGRFILIFLASYAAMGIFTCAIASDETELEPIYFTSEGPTPEIANYDVTKLYTDLKKNDLLPLRLVPNEKGLPLQSLLLENGVIFSKSGITPELSRLLCEINIDSCKLKPNVSKTTSRIYPVTWQNKAGDPIWIPNIDFEIRSSYRKYFKKQSTNLEQEIVENRQGCISFNEDCKEVILNLNKRNDAVLDPSYSGTIVIPSFGLEAWIIPKNKSKFDGENVITDNSIGPKGQESLIEGDSAIEAELRQQEKMSHANNERLQDTRDGSENKKSLEEKYKDIFRNSRGWNNNNWNYQPQSSHDSLSVDSEVLTNACEIKKSLLSIQSPDSINLQTKVRLGIVDKVFNNNHCSFSGMDVDSYQNHSNGFIKVSTNIEAEKNCNCELQEFVPFDDHGTHVATVLGSTLKSQDFTTSAASLPKLITLQYRHDNSSQAILSTLLGKAHGENNIEVFNFSLHVPSDTNAAGGADKKLEDLMKNSLSQSLIVAAAGNSNPGAAPVDLDVNCNIQPACYNLPNIVSVAALNLDLEVPALLGSSNFGSERVHVVAPGSLIAGNFNGTFSHASGTSQAAPIVTAVAAMMLAKNTKLLPEQIKTHLIVSSEFHPNLSGKAFGGIVNLERALEFDINSIQYQTSDDGNLKTIKIKEEIKGENVFHCLKEQFPCNSYRDNSGPIPWKSILRLVKQSNGKYTIIKLKQDGSTLERLDNVRLLLTSNVKINESTIVDATSIIDYQAKLR